MAWSGGECSTVAWRLTLEKLPLLALSAASCAVTLWAQTSAMVSVEGVSLALANRQRGRVRCRLSGPDVLAGGTGGSVPASRHGFGPGEDRSRLAGASGDLWIGRRLAAALSVPAGGLALVSGNARAGDRPGAGGACSPWRTAICICQQIGLAIALSLGRATCDAGVAASRPLVRHRRSGGAFGIGGTRLASGRLLARQ